MSWYFDMLEKKEAAKQRGMLSAFGERQAMQRPSGGMEILGGNTRVEGSMLSNEFDEAGNPINQRASIQPTRYDRTGYLGGKLSKEQALISMLDKGYSLQGAQSALGVTAKPTALQQQFDWFSSQDKPTQEKIMDFRKAGAQTINVGTNMKPPGGYRFKDPNNPQSSPVEPIPGGPATRGTGEQQKKIASFEGIRGMVNAMQQGLRDGVNPNSLSMTTTEMLKGVPVLSSMWEEFNGDAKKEAIFLNETENFGNTALQIMRGAQVGPAEQVKFEKSLPTKGMTKEQYENALNTSIRIFNDSMRSTMSQLGGGQPFEPIAPSDIFSTDQANRLDELRRKRDGAN